MFGKIILDEMSLCKSDEGTTYISYGGQEAVTIVFTYSVRISLLNSLSFHMIALLCLLR